LGGVEPAWISPDAQPAANGQSATPVTVSSASTRVQVELLRPSERERKSRTRIVVLPGASYSRRSPPSCVAPGCEVINRTRVGAEIKRTESISSALVGDYDNDGGDAVLVRRSTSLSGANRVLWDVTLTDFDAQGVGSSTLAEGLTTEPQPFDSVGLTGAGRSGWRPLSRPHHVPDGHGAAVWSYQLGSCAFRLIALYRAQNSQDTFATLLRDGSSNA
jgi:hypothetical protein